jgi:hypothetical protein
VLPPKPIRLPTFVSILLFKFSDKGSLIAGLYKKIGVVPLNIEMVFF